jgi:2-dehydro-3-deoxyphosphogluconate aldolase/(4S)-4-hydroxy-2-oxoglutarate aldolase
MEITLNSENALQDIRTLVDRFGTRLNIGAGTVCDLEGMDAALEAGAQFVVMPIVDEDVIGHCASRGIPVFPGAYTPTEIYRAWKLGASMVKVFPANDLGPGYIKDVLAPLNKIALMPTGGLTKENMGDFFKAGAKAMGIGSSIVPKSFINNRDWEGLKHYLNEFYTHLQTVKSSF